MLLHKDSNSSMVYFIQSFLAFRWSVNWSAEVSKLVILSEQRFHGLHVALCTLFLDMPSNISTGVAIFSQTVDRLIMVILPSPLPFLPVLILHETACTDSLIHILQTFAPKDWSFDTCFLFYHNSLIVSSRSRYNLPLLIPFQKLSTWFPSRKCLIIGCVVVFKALWWILSSTCVWMAFYSAQKVSSYNLHKKVSRLHLFS